MLFVAASLDQGAACAIVEQDFTPGDEERLVRVGDTLEALNDLGRASRARATDTVVIAVTGSAGKTGTKEALKLALAPSGSVHASAKSYNNHWGVPLSLANMPEGVRFGVFEIGMNHAGEIDLLTRLVRPHIAIITTVAPVHLGFFRSVEDDRRRQGGNLPRAGAGRRRDHQSRQSSFRAAQATALSNTAPRSSASARHRAPRRG